MRQTAAVPERYRDRQYASADDLIGGDWADDRALA